MKKFVAFVLLSIVSSPVLAEIVSIGVLAYDGRQQAVARWQPTADYLSQHIASYNFQIVPLTHAEFEHSINKGEMDFILTNPGHYVRLEVAYGVTRIATFKAKFQDRVLTRFSSVIFTRRDSDLSNLESLKGKSLAAVSEGAFGGFQLAQDALLDREINVLQDMQVLWLGFPHSDVVKAILDKVADVGTVRSGVLEKMTARGELDPAQIKILNPLFSDDFPLQRSVGLYPEWPFAKLPDTDDALAKEVAISLFQMAEQDPAALKAGGAGWTIPLDYTAVHSVLRRLQVDPYPPVAMGVSAFWDAYQGWVISLGFLLLIALMSWLRVSRANRQLKATQSSLQRHQVDLEQTVQQRTEELRDLNRELQEDVTRRIQTEQSLSEGCDTLQALYSIFTRQDLGHEQRLQSMVDLARHFLGAELALLSQYKNSHFEMCTLSPPEAVHAGTPLKPELAQKAINDQHFQFYRDEATDEHYILYPVFISGNLHCLLEFLSSRAYRQQENRPGLSRLDSELEHRILKLISQWVGNEVEKAQQENAEQAELREMRERFEKISPREEEVLKLLVQSESTKSMARLLNISVKTVELHRANLLRKTGAKSSIELVKLAALSGISR